GPPTISRSPWAPFRLPKGACSAATRDGLSLILRDLEKKRERRPDGRAIPSRWRGQDREIITRRAESQIAYTTRVRAPNDCVAHGVRWVACPRPRGHGSPPLSPCPRGRGHATPEPRTFPPGSRPCDG